MGFENIHCLWFLLVIPLFAFFSLRAYRLSDQWLRLFAREKKKFVPCMLNTIFISLAIAALTLAIAEPGIQYEKTVFNRAGIELAIGIDVSKSMLAEDVYFPMQAGKNFNAPNRLNHARWLARGILSELHGESAGVYIFADKGVEIAPLTRDYGYCRYILTHLNDASLTLPGSDLGEAVHTGISMLEASPHVGAKMIILLSDGEDITPDNASLIESAQYARRKGIRVYTLGFGNVRDVLISLKSADGASVAGYYTDEHGAYLKTRLVQDKLKLIADITRGQYYRVNAEENIPKKLSEAVLQEAGETLKMRRTEPAWLDMSPFFLLLGMIFFAFGMLVRSSAFRRMSGAHAPDGVCNPVRNVLHIHESKGFGS